MHEIGVLTKAVDLVESVAKDNGLDHIGYITLEIGELTGYVPLFFEKYFPVVTEDRPIFQGTELRIQTVRGQALCADCQSLYNVMKQEGRCPKCGKHLGRLGDGEKVCPHCGEPLE